ncbi:MAG: PD-(D/E)XK nuclease domain-containing protein, partial [Succinimonas sp.]|nr:PD-(D/E)XK nuclease domain-containing protein [Succinimonas sp.]
RIIVILELKQTEDENRDTVLIARSAIDQILDKKYADPYLERNDIDGVYAFGISFCKKSCSVAARTLK